MSKVTVSPKFQVVIPKKERETLGIRPGEKMEMFIHENRLELVPVKPIKSMRGFLKGIDTTVIRDKDRV